MYGVLCRGEPTDLIFPNRAMAEGSAGYLNQKGKANSIPGDIPYAVCEVELLPVGYEAAQ